MRRPSFPRPLVDAAVDAFFGGRRRQADDLGCLRADGLEGREVGASGVALLSTLHLRRTFFPPATSRNYDWRRDRKSSQRLESTHSQERLLLPPSFWSFPPFFRHFWRQPMTDDGRTGGVLHAHGLAGSLRHFTSAGKRR